MTQKPFIFFLIDTPTGLAYYKDAGYITQKGNIFSGNDINLDHAPDGWLTTSLGFARSSSYKALFQQFAAPQKFVGSAASIIRELYYGGRGIEVPLSLLVYKLNTAPAVGEPAYKFYCKQQLDLSKISDSVSEGVTVSLIQGGAARALKAYENTIFEIPCDGSIPENIKVNLDGQYYKNTVYYNVSPVEMPDNAFGLLPINITSQDGESVDTIVADQSYQVIPTGTSLGKIFPLPKFFQGSGGFAYEQVSPSKVTVEGTVIIKPFGKALDSGDHTQEFVLALDTPNGLKRKIVWGGFVNQQTTITFKTTIALAGNESLFLNFYSKDISAIPKNGNIVGGQIQLSYLSIVPPTRAYCIKLIDAFKIVIKDINELSNATTTAYNFTAQSSLLESLSNLVLSSGDAIRASGDPTYQKFYNTIQNNPNLQNINLSYSYGPVIKITLKQIFDIINALTPSCMGSIQNGSSEAIFIEDVDYVYTPTLDPTKLMVLPEVSDLIVEFAEDMIFNVLKIGYEPQQYDQKSGKYEPNTLAVWQSEIKSIQNKILEIKCPARADATGIEDLRSNINSTSTTRNGGDNDIFIINTDPSLTSSDFWVANFTSLITDTSDPFNTNIILKAGQNIQPVQMVAANGEFFASLTDQSIFVLNQVGLSGVSMPLSLNLSGNFNGYPANALNGTPADFAIITIYVNGVAVTAPFQVFASGASVPINLINYGVTRNWSYKDVIYIGIQTSANGTLNIDAAELTLGTAGAYMDAIAAGGIVIDPGTNQQLLSFATINAAIDANGWPKVSTGFQYFVFNTVLLNSDFKLDFALNSVISGGIANVDLFINGVSVYNSTSGPGGTHEYNSADSFNRTFNLGDIIFIGASTIITTGSGTNMEITSALLKLTSLFITVIGLKRDKYDSLIGIPNYAYPLGLDGLPDYTQLPDSSLPGAPFNLVYMTPKQMLLRWGKWLRSILFNQIPGTLFFASLSKNQFVSTTIGSITITENADVDLSTLDAPIVYPIKIKFKTKVGINFSDLMLGAANSHIQFSYNGLNGFFVYADDVKQQSPLNEMQDWVTYCSPATALAIFKNLNISGLNQLFNES